MAHGYFLCGIGLLARTDGRGGWDAAYGLPLEAAAALLRRLDAGDPAAFAGVAKIHFG